MHYNLYVYVIIKGISIYLEEKIVDVASPPFAAATVTAAGAAMVAKPYIRLRCRNASEYFTV